MLEDFTTDVGEALAAGDKAGATELSKSWPKESQAWWMAMSTSKRDNPDDATDTKKKTHRRKAHKWLSSTDKILREITDEGWSTRLYEGGLPVNLVNMKGVTVSLDQGSDGWSAVFYLLNFRSANLVIVPDLAHRIWNDTKAALRQAKLMGLVWLATVCFNFEHGPWTDKRWFRTGQEGAHIYSTAIDVDTCPVWGEYGPGIAEDRGYGEDFYGPRCAARSSRSAHRGLASVRYLVFMVGRVASALDRVDLRLHIFRLDDCKVRAAHAR